MSRQSLAPAKARNQLADSFAGLNINGLDRRATMGLRSSITGRQSIYGRQSLSMNTPQIAKDPRPIKDKKWQANAINRLITFLVNSGYPHPVSPKTLTPPTSKDFQTIFKFLYAQLDPYFEFQKKFEEEVPVILKGLRYPFADQISKSNLFTVGSLHAWPTLLAMLIWMMELILCVDHLDEDSSDLNENEQAEKMFFEYLTKAYSLWLSGANDLDIIDRTLLENFERKDEKNKKDIEKLNKEYEILEKEWNTLRKSESPLTLLEREEGLLLSDKEKFQNYIAHIEAKKQKLYESVLFLQQEFEASEETVKNLTSERAHLNATVDAQELSPTDVDRMNAERDQLSKNLQKLSVQLDDINKAVWNKEIAVQKKMDSLERSCEKFNSLLYKLDLLGRSNPKFSALSQELKIDVQQSKVDAMVSINLRKQVKPSLFVLIESYKNAFFKITDECIALSEKLDSFNWNVIKKREEIQSIESKIHLLSDRYNQEKEQIGNGLMNTTKEMENMEREIQQLKKEAHQVMYSSQQKLQVASKKYQETFKTLNAQREQLMAQVIKSLTVSFSFEQHVSHSLNEFEKQCQEELDNLTAIEL
ncbi:kinetochore-associated Ndc80 complex subunit ndc80 [Terramyces sp. JEL0728]|nr:kinetochore-associated Ndc80 complex subunit ndc80 [Terramyces sp. JEL0728]